MSEPTDKSVESKRERLATVFGNDIDPLLEYEERLKQAGIDLFDIYVEDVLSEKDRADSTVKAYHRTYQQFRDYMAGEGRHPACPNEGHVRGFIRDRRERYENEPATIRMKLDRLRAAFSYWQADPALPHGTDYNPYEQVLQKVEFADDGPEKDHRRVTVEELREKLSEVKHVRDRAIIALQLKCGLRASEVCNIRLSDLSLAHGEIQGHYGEVGSDSRLGGRENVLLVPEDRDRNKSLEPRLLPLDDEMRGVLLRYLLIRPDNGEPWLFLSKQRHRKLRQMDINRPWKNAFHPEYAETEEYRPISSHFGRHRFTTYWRVEQDMSLELVKYMRGDRPGDSSSKTGIEHYIHTYYEDIEGLYREKIYKLGV